MTFIGKHTKYHNMGPGSLLVDGGDKILFPHQCTAGELVSDRHYHVYLKYAYASAFLNQSSDFHTYEKLYLKMQSLKGRIPDLIGFNRLIMNIQNEGFDTSQPIPIDCNYDILDGSHRLAACLALDIFPTVQMYTKMSKPYEKNVFSSFTPEEISLIDAARIEVLNRFKPSLVNEIVATVWGMTLPLWNDVLDFIGKDNIKRAFLRHFTPEEYAAFTALVYSTDGISFKNLSRKTWALTKFDPSAGTIVLNMSQEGANDLKVALRRHLIEKVKFYNFDSIFHTIDDKEKKAMEILSVADVYKPVGDMPINQDFQMKVKKYLSAQLSTHIEYQEALKNVSNSRTPMLDAIQDRIKLAIFDLDGILVDSELIHANAYIQILSEYGIVLSQPEAVKLFSGQSKTDNARKLEEKYGIVFSEEQEIRKKQWIRVQKQKLQTVVGIRDLIQSIPCQKCVASGSSMETIDISLKATGLDEIFPLHKRFSSQMVERGKPHPDIFLLVAEKMSVDPQDCMVIEDSPAGVQAARVARMNFIWYGLGSHVSQAYGSDVLYFMTEHFKKMPNMK